MKTLIVYSSHFGATEKCARLVADKLGSEVTLLKARDCGAMRLQDFDRIILGSGIEAGKIGKSMRSFLKRYGRELAAKDVGLFLCSGGEEPSYFQTNFPPAVLAVARERANFGGELDLTRLSPFLRGLLKIFGVKEGYSKLKPDEIERFAAKMAQRA